MIQIKLLYIKKIAKKFLKQKNLPSGDENVLRIEVQVNYEFWIKVVFFLVFILEENSDDNNNYRKICINLYEIKSNIISINALDYACLGKPQKKFLH